MFLNICLCLLGCLFYWHTIVHCSLLFTYLYFCNISCNFPLSVLILIICVFSLFFLVSPCRGLSFFSLSLFSKNQLFITFFCVFIPILFVSLIFIIFLTPADFRFCFSFPYSFIELAKRFIFFPIRLF